MKICHIITALSFGGAERLLVNTMNPLAEQHQITIVYLKPLVNDIVPLFDKRIRIVCIPMGFAGFFELRAFLKSYSPDVIHTHLGHADLWGLTASTGLKAKKICTMHNIWFKFTWIDYIIFGLYQLVFSFFAKKVTVICISEIVRNHVISTLGVPPERAVLIYNAVPDVAYPVAVPEYLTLRKAQHTGPVLLFVGRLEKQKAVHTLLEALALLKSMPSPLLLIVGEGSLRADLTMLAERLGVADRVVFVGGVKDTAPYYQVADLFILPSIFEGMGIVIVEAFRASLPVVASEVEGPKELIQHGHNGWLVPKERPDLLAESIDHLLSNQPLRQQIGQKGRKVFEDRFLLQHYLDALQCEYHSPSV